MKQKAIDKEVRKESFNIVALGIKLAFCRIFMSQSKYNKYLKEQINDLNDSTFRLYATQLLECIKLTKKRSIIFKNSYKETDVILAQFPRFKSYQKHLFKYVKEHRIKNRLPS